MAPSDGPLQDQTWQEQSVKFKKAVEVSNKHFKKTKELGEALQLKEAEMTALKETAAKLQEELQV